MYSPLTAQMLVDVRHAELRADAERWHRSRRSRSRSNGGESRRRRLALGFGRRPTVRPARLALDGRP